MYRTLCLCFALSVAVPVYADTAVNVLTNRYDTLRTGANTHETHLTLANVHTDFGKLYTLAVKGNVYAQPLYMAAAPIPRTVEGRQVDTQPALFVATEHNLVYAFAAPSNGYPDPKPLWVANLSGTDWITPKGWTVTTIPSTEFNFKLAFFTLFPYTDLVPEIGITSTPVIDASQGILYVVASTKEVKGTDIKFVHRLHALDITTGLKKCEPIEISGEVRGRGDGYKRTYQNNQAQFEMVEGKSVPKERVTFLPHQQLQRSGLLLHQGKVYIAFGSYGDLTISNPLKFPDYHGWLFSYEFKDGQLQVATDPFNTTPQGRTSLINAFDGNPAGAGIWMSGTGPAADQGNLYLATANGAFSANHKGGTEYGNSVLKLCSSDLKVSEFFTPHDQQCLRIMDRDLGSAGVLLIPQEDMISKIPLAVAGGKGGKIYLIHRGAGKMGGFRASGDSCLQTVNLGSIHENFGHIHAAPIYWKSQEGHKRIYVMAETDTLKAFEIQEGKNSRSPASLVRAGECLGLKAPEDSMPGGILSLSSNDGVDGIVWVSMPLGDANPGTVLGRLVAVNASTLEILWDSLGASRDRFHPDISNPESPGYFAKFNPVTVAEGRVYVPSFSLSNQFGAEVRLAVYGLRSSVSGQEAPAPLHPSLKSAGEDAPHTIPSPVLTHPRNDPTIRRHQEMIRAVNRAVTARRDALALPAQKRQDQAAYKTLIGGGFPDELRNYISDDLLAKLTADSLTFNTLINKTTQPSEESFPPSQHITVQTRVKGIAPHPTEAGKTILYAHYTIIVTDASGAVHKALTDTRSEIHRLEFDVYETWAGESNTSKLVAFTQRASSSAPKVARMNGHQSSTTIHAAHIKNRLDPDEWRNDRVSLDYHPIGFTPRQRGFTLENLQPQTPIGAPSDSHNLYLSPTYSFGKGWQLSSALSGIQRTDGSGTSLYYGAGIQKQILGEDCPVPVDTMWSVGLYGYTGQEVSGESVYLAASRRLFGGRTGSPFGLYAHYGVKLETFNGDRNGSGVRPYAGLNLSVLRRFFLSGEFSLRQSWETEMPFSFRATIPLFNGFGITAVVQSTGYHTTSYVGLYF